jgi:hypothetical protein
MHFLCVVGLHVGNVQATVDKLAKQLMSIGRYTKASANQFFKPIKLFGIRE